MKANSHTILEALREAGDAGMTAREIAEWLNEGIFETVISATNSCLQRALDTHRARRGEKERTVSAAGRNSRAHRWYITSVGLEYLIPKPLPVVNQLDEPPSSRRVLELLKEAGEEGMLGGVLTRHFTIPDPDMPSQQHLRKRSQNLQRRMAWTNQILDRFLLHGFVRRGQSEPSPYYHLVPVYRWFVTPEGVEYLAAGMGPGIRAARAAEARWWAERYRSERKQADDLVTRAYLRYDPATTYPCEREKAIREMRDAGCTLAEIGGVFGITRERTRQILVGFKPVICKCPKCTDAEWFEVGDGATA